MADIRQARKALTSRILDGDGWASRPDRRAAFHNIGLAEPLGTLVDKVAKAAYTITEEDVVSVKASGLSEDEVFELIVCAAIGQASRQYDSALVALDAVTGRK